MIMHNLEIFVSIVILVFIGIYLRKKKNINSKITETGTETDMYNTGYMIVENIIDDDDIKYILELWESKKYHDIKLYFLRNNMLNKKIKGLLSDSYELIDYVYIIENSAIHTYHRDYTSSRVYNNLKYPSYTMILYFDDNNSGLNIIPGSHDDNASIYLRDKSIKLNVNKGSAILFDADMLHAGSAINVDTKRHCIQFKIIHKDDIEKVLHLLNYYVLINRPNNKTNFLKSIETGFTKHIPIFMDTFNDPIKSSFVEEKTSLQKWISSLVFSNKDFYKPIRI